MKNKKHTTVAVIISVALILVASGTAIALGAGKAAVYKDSQLVIINESAAQIFSIDVNINNETHAVSNADNTLIKKGEKVNFQLDITKGTVFQVTVTDADWNLITKGVFAKHSDDTQIVLYIRDDENGNTYIIDEGLRDFAALRTPYVGNNSAVGNVKSFTLNDVRALAAKGDGLLMEDFTKYEGRDVGSGLYILHFSIEGGYELLVGNGSATGAPMYVMLSIPGFEESIDIRHEDIDDFIGRYPMPNDISNQVLRCLDIIMSSPKLSSATGDYIKAHQDEYDALLDMGITALPALTGVLESGDRGLRGNIAQMAVTDIIELKSRKPQSDWAGGVLQNAEATVERWSGGFSVPPTQNEMPSN